MRLEDNDFQEQSLYEKTCLESEKQTEERPRHRKLRDFDRSEFPFVACVSFIRLGVKTIIREDSQKPNTHSVR